MDSAGLVGHQEVAGESRGVDGDDRGGGTGAGGAVELHPREGTAGSPPCSGKEGWNVGKRQVRRLRRLEGLRVPPTKRKLPRRGRSTGLPTKATHKNHVWTWDFIADATMRGGSIRMLTVLDEHTRECHVLSADRALKSADVIELVKGAVAQHGAPEYIRSDNGSEFIAKELQRWLAENKIKIIYIEPGSPRAERLRRVLPRALPR